MYRFWVLLLLVCFGVNTLDAAPQEVKGKKKTKKTEVVEEKQQKIEINVGKLCGGSRPLRVAGMVGNAPFGWVERDISTKQKMESFGLGRVVFDKIAKELDLRYISTGYTSQDDAIQALSRGDIDLLLGLYHRSYGPLVEILYPAYFTNVFTVYFKKGKELPIESYKDLSGLKGVVRKEEMIYPMIYQKLPDDVDLREVLSAPTAFEMLMNDEVDYILASPYALEGELRRYKMQDDIVSNYETLGSGTLFFAFSKNSPCLSLKNDISKVIREQGFSQQTLDSDIQELINDWGERFRSDEVLIKTKHNTLPQNMKEEEIETKEKEENNKS